MLFKNDAQSWQAIVHGQDVDFGFGDETLHKNILSYFLEKPDLSLIDFLKPKTHLKGKDFFHAVRGFLTGRLDGPNLQDLIKALNQQKIAQVINEKYNLT